MSRPFNGYWAAISPSGPRPANSASPFAIYTAFLDAGAMVESRRIGPARCEANAPIAGAKDLNAHLDHRLPNPRKAHKSALNHP